MKDMVVDIDELRDNIANFDDFFRPIRNYLYWEPHCYDIPVCWSIRSVFDTLDGIDTMTDDIQAAWCRNLDALDTLMPQLIGVAAADDRDHEDHEDHDADDVSDPKGHAGPDGRDAGELDRRWARRSTRRRTTTRSTCRRRSSTTPTSRSGMKNFISPDGKSVRFIISHEGDPMTRRGHLAHRRHQAGGQGSHQGHPAGGLARSTSPAPRRRSRTCPTANTYDLLIAGIASLALIFIIMLIITRAVVASAVIVGTVVLSLGASFGLSVLIWQHILGIELHWMVMAMSVIILLAVGADYNLLLVSRFKEEIHAGPEHRHHPSDGRHRFRGDLGRPGVRVHHDVDGGQRARPSSVRSAPPSVSACCSTPWWSGRS